MVPQNPTWGVTATGHTHLGASLGAPVAYRAGLGGGNPSAGAGRGGRALERRPLVARPRWGQAAPDSGPSPTPRAPGAPPGRPA